MTWLGVVLAGGRSSRMGSDKALLKWRGRTLLEHSVQLLRDAGASQILVSGRSEHALGIADLFPHAGPPAAVHSLLHFLEQTDALNNRAILLIPVDMPLLQSVTLRALLDACAAGEAARYKGEVFPCVLPASPALLEYLCNCSGPAESPGGAGSMKEILQWLPCRELLVSSTLAHELRNINSPEDWKLLDSLPEEP